MSELNNRSLRLLIDMQACQTEGSGPRGVGRYSKALFSSLTSHHAMGYDIFANLSRQLPLDVGLNELSESRILRSPPLPNWGTNRDFHGGERDTLDGLALSAFFAPVKPDIIHISHVFEGFSDRVAMPSMSSRMAGQIISATLYDLIPLLFQSHYFQNEAFRRWYIHRLSWLQQADLLLAISESSRQDAISLLGIDPSRIVTIYGGISSHFLPALDCQMVRNKLNKKYGLKGRFVLYTGGDDHRKNISGAIEGYAAVPHEVRKNCQLVIVCEISAERKQRYTNEALSAGLSNQDLVFTGFVTEEDLVNFYSICDLFLFPSLYEGLGLPVLEAMACGAPVIGGNNSSVKELISRPDALFDASSYQSIAAAITKGLGNKDYLKSLSEYGLVRSKEFSWEKTASLALDAFEETARRTRESGIQCAVQGWLPRKRLAIFTPLPPLRSGIADYNKEFLPYLSRHFDIDIYVDEYKVTDETINSAFRIFNAIAFEAVASKYDAILYEFGNSEYHAYMLPILKHHPGIVGLHDAYLSGVFGYLEFYQGHSGSFYNEMLYSHGPIARRLLAPIQNHLDPVGAAHSELPCTKNIIDNAIGIISHSPFNLKVAHQNYPEGWQAPYRTIPQMVSVVQPWNEAQKEATRKDLGFANDDFIVTSFGHVVWTKWGDRLLDAFLNSILRDTKQVHLVFAGEIAKDDFGLRLMQAIDNSGAKHRIRVTGYLSSKDYERYLRISDVAIQLRTKSRGGTPKGVLDCLALGLAVIVNDDASYQDYPKDTVIKLSAEPSIEEIASMLERVFLNPAYRMPFSYAGLEYVRSKHNPVVCAAAYAAAIHEFIERHAHTKQSRHISEFAPHIAGCDDPKKTSQEAVNWLSIIPSPNFTKKKIYIDVSHIAEFDHNTGIQRIVKEITSALYCSSLRGFEPVAVKLEGQGLVIASDWLETRGLLLPHEMMDRNKNLEVEFHAGDLLFMLDSSWSRFKEFYPVFKKAREACVQIYCVVNDLLPIRIPSCFTEGAKDWFEGWLRDAISVSDGVVCISRATAEDLISYMKSNPIARSSELKVGFWHLGANFSEKLANENPDAKVIEMSSKPYLLMVGTIEPRKSHELALNAIEVLWEQGSELCLCIAGKEGWMVSHFIERLRQHPQLNKKLYFFEGASDTNVHFLYKHSLALLFLSRGEGFGLPLIEAAHYGVPIICSNIPVFHEIAGKYATYVNNSDASLLAKDLAIWWECFQKKNISPSAGMPYLTWEQSSKMLFNVLVGDEWIEKI